MLTDPGSKFSRSVKISPFNIDIPVLHFMTLPLEHEGRSNENIEGIESHLFSEKEIEELFKQS